jgi:hypothetical protein
MQIDLGLNPKNVVSVSVTPRPRSPQIGPRDPRLGADRRADLAASHTLIMAALARTQRCAALSRRRCFERPAAVRHLMSVPVQLPVGRTRHSPEMTRRLCTA